MTARRKLLYDFMSLSYVDIVRIGAELNLLPLDSDTPIKDEDIEKHIFQAAETKGLMDKLSAEVTKAKAK